MFVTDFFISVLRQYKWPFKGIHKFTGKPFEFSKKYRNKVQQQPDSILKREP